MFGRKLGETISVCMPAHTIKSGQKIPVFCEQNSLIGTINVFITDLLDSEVFKVILPGNYGGIEQKNLIYALHPDAVQADVLRCFKDEKEFVLILV